MPDTNILGKCPACGGDVVESDKAYGCSNWRTDQGGCRFSIWKTIAQRAISPSEARMLLENGKTERLRGFVSKKERPFDARLVLNEDFRVIFNFDD